jgi:hypothetical protein
VGQGGGAYSGGEAAGTADAPPPPGQDDGEHLDDNPRLRAMALGLRWGLLIGVVAGGVAGTFVVIVVGTIFGIVYGVIGAAGPTIVGSVALWFAAKPGTSATAFRRRVAAILTVLGLVVAVAAFVITSPEASSDETFDGPILLGAGIAIFLLLYAYRAIAEVTPAPAGTPTTGADRAVVVLLAALVVVPALSFAWTRALSPEARDRRSIESERDALLDDMGLDVTHRSSRTEYCGPRGTNVSRTGPATFGIGEPRSGDRDAALEALTQGRRELEARGYAVSFDEGVERLWAYGVRGDRTVVIGPAFASDGGWSFPVRVDDGCPQQQPTFEPTDDGGRDAPMLVAAGYVPIDERLPRQCLSLTDSRTIVIGTNGWIGSEAEQASEWVLTTRSGRRLAPCSLLIERESAVLEVPTEGDEDDPVVEAAISVTIDAEGDGQPDGPPERLAIAVPDPGAPVQAIEALSVGGSDEGTSDTEQVCPVGTVQGVVVRWARPLHGADLFGGESRAFVGAEGDYEVSVERDGEVTTAVPTSVESPGSFNPYTAATEHLLCLDVPGRPIEVRGDASDRFDPGGPSTEAFQLAMS